jgi:hypothetical protein
MLGPIGSNKPLTTVCGLVSPLNVVPQSLHCVPSYVLASLRPKR